MARPTYSDPLPAFKFYVLVDDFVEAGFSEMTPPGVHVTTKEYYEGGEIQGPHTSVDKIGFRNIVLKRGVTTNSDMADWVERVFTETAGRGRVSNMLGKVKSGLTKAASGLAEDVISSTAGAVLGDSFGSALGSIAGGMVGSLIRRSWGANANYRKSLTIVQLDRSNIPTKSWRVYNAFPVNYEPADGYDAQTSKCSVESLEIAYEGFEQAGETEIKNILETGLYDSIESFMSAVGF